MVTTRAQLAGALTFLLSDDFRIIEYPTELDAIEGSVRGVVMLYRQTITPAPNQAGSRREAFELVVIEPRTDQDGIAEDHLDEITDDLAGALDALDWLTWSEATRSTYNNVQPAYKFTITINTKKE